jgi:hypothetical protein
MVVALISLFVSLGGVSYGVATGAIDSREILNDTVRSQDVRNGEIRTQDLRNNDVRTRDLRNNDIRSYDIRNNEIRGRDIFANTITRGDIAFDTLTGGSILESSLGTVPSAATVAGLVPRNFRYTGNATTPTRTILDLGGLRLQANCIGGPQLVTNDAVRYIRAENDVVTTGSAIGDLTGSGEGQLHITFLRSDGGHVAVMLSYRTDATNCAIGGHAVAG